MTVLIEHLGGAITTVMLCSRVETIKQYNSTSCTARTRTLEETVSSSHADESHTSLSVLLFAKLA